MFYAYQLSEEIPSAAVAYNQTLSVAATETVVAVVRSGVTPKVLSAVTAQVAARRVALGKLLFRTFTAAVAVARVTFHLNVSTFAAASPSAAALTKRHLAKLVLSVGLTGAPALRHTTPFHNVLATHFVGVTVLARDVGKRLNRALPTVVGLIRGKAAQNFLVSAASAAALRRLTGIERVVLADESLAVRLGSRRILATTSPSIVSRGRGLAKRFAATAAETAKLYSMRPQRLLAVTTQAAAALRRRSFFRVLGLVATEAMLVRRGLADIRRATSAQSAAVTQRSGHVLGTVSAESARVLRTAGRLLFAQSSNVAGIRRLFGTAKHVIAATAITLVPIARHLVAMMTALAQVAQEASRIIRGRILVVAEASVAALLSHATLTLPSVLSTTQGQAVAIRRGMARSIALVMAGVLAVTRRIGMHPLLVIQPGVVLARRRAGKARGAAMSLVAALRPGIIRSSILLAVTPAVVFLRASAIRLKLVAQGSVAHLTRTVNRLIATQTVEHLSRGVGSFRRYGVTQPEVVLGAAARGRDLHVVQVQVARAIPWYHLFVPAWAYQQTTLLPPLGGPAEPMYFGVIDPADQTTFAFDWSKRLRIDDAILEAAVTSVPAGLTFAGPVFVRDKLVQATVAPFSPVEVPSIYSLRCSVRTASGRRSSYSIPVPVRTL